MTGYGTNVYIKLSYDPKYLEPQNITENSLIYFNTKIFAFISYQPGYSRIGLDKQFTVNKMVCSQAAILLFGTTLFSEKNQLFIKGDNSRVTLLFLKIWISAISLVADNIC